MDVEDGFASKRLGTVLAREGSLTGVSPLVDPHIILRREPPVTVGALPVCPVGPLEVPPPGSHVGEHAVALRASDGEGVG